MKKNVAKKNTSREFICSAFAVALGMLQIAEYSVTDTHIMLIIRFTKIAVMFLAIGYNLPK